MSHKIDPSWEALLGQEFEKEYYKNIQKFLQEKREKGIVIFPKQDDIFTAFNATSVENLKVVVLGQDPYHGAGQAHGLSFSVQEGIKIPPSLRNVYKELSNEYPGYAADSGSLIHWAEQGVLLLNSILTVEEKKPASHAKIGWADFTDAVLKNISDSQQGIAFVLWGAFAQSKKMLIDCDKHFILESPHPSPFSAHRGFLGNGHFKQINQILKDQGKEEIIW